MARDRALYAMTMAGARMLQLDGRIGTLEPGKDADFILISGDPLAVAMLRARLLEAQEYVRKQEGREDGRPPRNLGLGCCLR
jgi:imidazolonepropionase-like amidohydrolase